MLNKITFLPNDGIEILNRISVFEIVSLVGFLIAVISLFISMRAFNSQAKTTRAEFAFKVWQSFMQDDLQKAFLEVEWGKFDYPYASTNGFKDDEQERGIDKVMTFLDELASMFEDDILSKREATRWEYVGRRFFSDQGIRNYLSFLDEFYIANGVEGRPYDAARKRFVLK